MTGRNLFDEGDPVEVGGSLGRFRTDSEEVYTTLSAIFLVDVVFSHLGNDTSRLCTIFETA